MIKGIGIDVVEISRIREAMGKHGFARKILTDEECRAQLTPQYVAGRWAAKEAVFKATQSPKNWHDVEIIADGEKKPAVSLPGVEGTIHLSISHERGMAVAVAIWEV